MFLEKKKFPGAEKYFLEADKMKAEKQSIVFSSLLTQKMKSSVCEICNLALAVAVGHSHFHRHHHRQRHTPNCQSVGQSSCQTVRASVAVAVASSDRHYQTTAVRASKRQTKTLAIRGPQSPLDLHLHVSKNSTPDLQSPFHMNSCCFTA